jgi:hypothetical protein
MHLLFTGQKFGNFFPGPNVTQLFGFETPQFLKHPLIAS